MRGFCPTCQEYRSENGLDAWGIVWKDGVPVCERCNSVVDMWERYKDRDRQRYDGYNNSSEPSAEEGGEADSA